MQLSDKLLQVARLGGPIILWLLIILSVLSIGVIVERWWWFRRRRVDSRALGAELLAALREGGLEDARGVLGRSRAVEAEIVTEALEWYDQGTDAFLEILEKGVRDRRAEIEGGLLYLGTLGNNAPFIGLFGTVLGIVTAFRELGAATTGGAGSMNNVMGGIAEALIATAVGILVAIPAVVAYNVFARRAAQVEENVGALGNVVVAHLVGTGRTPAAGAGEPGHHPHHRIGATSSGVEV
jgi:biopolymer transport protein ExbB/biopolymer transport protein TolQ